MRAPPKSCGRGVPWYVEPAAEGGTRQMGHYGALLALERFEYFFALFRGRDVQRKTMA